MFEKRNVFSIVQIDFVKSFESGTGKRERERENDFVGYTKKSRFV
jgi:hypothetical protein